MNSNALKIPAEIPWLSHDRYFILNTTIYIRIYLFLRAVHTALSQVSGVFQLAIFKKRIILCNHWTSGEGREMCMHERVELDSEEWLTWCKTHFYYSSYAQTQNVMWKMYGNKKICIKIYQKLHRFGHVALGEIQNAFHMSGKQDSSWWMPMPARSLDQKKLIGRRRKWRSKIELDRLGSIS